MSTTTTDPNAAVKAQAEEIVTSGTDIRPRLAEVVAQNACESQQSGGLVALIRAVIDGAREGLDRAVPQDRDAVLRQVVDALGDGLSQAALAGQLALQEAAGSSRQFEKGDLASPARRPDRGSRPVHGDDRPGVGRPARRSRPHRSPPPGGTPSASRSGSGRPSRRPSTPSGSTRSPSPGRASRPAPARGRCAAGALFQALGRMLQRAGDRMRSESEPNSGPVGRSARAAAEATNTNKGNP